MRFNRGDKVVCISNKYNDFDGLSYSKVWLTIGKSYIVKYIDEYEIFVENDAGVEKGYLIRRFVSLKEYRRMKLEKLESRL
jgi:hypothetical protein